jgi:hypothetical protein
MSSTTEVISHWSTLIEGFQFSPQMFYDMVGQAIARRCMPYTTVSRVQFREGNFLSAKRDYLWVKYAKEDFYFAICGGQFGTGFFVSYWQLQPPDGCIVQLFSPFPILSAVARALVRPWTYYRVDTVTMFNTAVHQAVLEVVDTITSSAQGVRRLLESERKPVLKEFFKS